MNHRFLTLEEVADALRVSESTVRRAVKAGELAAARIGSLRQIRVSPQALDDYIVRSSTGKRGAVGNSARVASTTTQGPPSEDETRSVEDVRGLDKVEDGLVHEGHTSSAVPWKIINADVRSGLEMLPPKSVQCVVTSPPYYWQRDYEVPGQIGHERTIRGYVDVIADVFQGLKRVLAEDGTVFLNLGDTYYSAKGRPHGRDDKHNGRQMMRRQLRAVDGPGLGLPRKSLIGIPWRVVVALQDSGWTLRSDVIWQRPGSLPEPTAHDRPWRTYEHIFILAKGPRYFFNRQELQGEEDIWRMVARPENPGAHFAPYPRELVEKCLACGCPPGGTVLDPFVGSGTTMLAALRRRLPAMGIDIKREYCDFIKSRIMNEL